MNTYQTNYKKLNNFIRQIHITLELQKYSQNITNQNKQPKANNTNNLSIIPNNNSKMQKTNKYDTQSRTVIQVATQLIDSVNNGLFKEIKIGNLQVDEEEIPLNILQRRNNDQNEQQSGLVKKKSKILEKMNTIDLDQHKRMIKRFMSQNRRIKRQRQMRSIQLSEKSMKMRQIQQKQREQSKNKALQQRRKQIQKRLQQKKNLMKQIRKSTLQANSTISQIRRKKFLYQQKQQQYYKKIVLPKIQQQRQLLQNRKTTLRKPMDMNEIFQHQKHYEQLRINSRVNRSLTISVIKTKSKEYHPPQFVPQSFKKLKEQEQRQRMQQQQKRRQAELNQFRKKQFVKKVDELREMQRQKQLQKSKDIAKPESPQKQQAKLKQKAKLNRQQIKNVGNQYLKQLISKNRKYIKKQKSPTQSDIFDSTTPSQQKKHKSQYQIQIIRQERIEQIHKIRNKKIHDLMNDKKLDQFTKKQKLKYQIEKLDFAVQQKFMQSKNVQTINQGAMLMINSIQAKMALLGVDLIDNVE